MYETKGSEIFDGDGVWFEYENSDKGLKKLLLQNLGDKTLKEAKTNVAVTTCAEFEDNYSYSEGIILTNMNEVDKDVKMIDAALSTSAAPTYFPYHEFEFRGKKQSFVDGGVVCNNPSLMA